MDLSAYSNVCVYVRIYDLMLMLKFGFVFLDLCYCVSDLVLMFKFGFVFLDLCYCVSNLVLIFKFGFVLQSLGFCVSEPLLLCSLNGFGLDSLKEMRFYGFVFLYFGACCVCIVSMLCLILNFLGLCLNFLFLFFFFVYFFCFNYVLYFLI